MWQLLEFMWTGGYARLDTLLILHGYERMRFMFIPTNESKRKMDHILFVKKIVRQSRTHLDRLGSLSQRFKKSR